jgi:hypothetical protein
MEHVYVLQIAGFCDDWPTTLGVFSSAEAAMATVPGRDWTGDIMTPGYWESRGPAAEGGPFAHEDLTIERWELDTLVQ